MLEWLRRLVRGTSASPPAPEHSRLLMVEPEVAGVRGRAPSAVPPSPQPPRTTPPLNRAETVARLTATTKPPDISSAPGTAGRLPVYRVMIGIGHTAPGTLQVMAPRTRPRDDVRWVPPGGLVTMQGFDIPGGMVYVGSFLSAAPDGSWGAELPAPCLINPALKVAKGRVNTQSDMGYWPSYSAITPEHRLTYLTWLSSGKRDASFPVGYAFLYFYGLERRLLVDNPSADEEAALVAEVESLRDLYAANNSFSGYSQRLLEAVELRRLSAVPGGLADWKPDLITIKRGSALPPPLQFKLALHAVTGVPVDCVHATAAMLAMSPFQGGPPSTLGMSRTRKVFVELVRRRFAARFPNGYRLRDRKDSTLSALYPAAAQHLRLEFRIQGVKRLPDPATLTWTKMAQLCAQAAEDLTSYAKLVGKNGSGANSLAASAALPPDLADLGASAPFKQWLDSLPAPVAEVPLVTLGSWCLGAGKEAIGAKQAREMSALLASFGFGMEPDPAHGGEKPGGEVLVFRTGQAALPSAFPRAALAASVLASAEPGPDPARVVSELAARLRLDVAAATRLAARFRLMRGRPLPSSKLKTITATLPEFERSVVAALTAAVAAACGEVTHATQAALERLHDACGVDRRELYRVLHEVTRTLAATEPVVVEQRSNEGGAYRIPPPSERPKPNATPGAFAIDMAKVHAILRETREVAEVLAPIYQDEDEVPATLSEPPAAVVERDGSARFPGLKPDHARLLMALREREEWTRAEFEALAREMGLMPEGAIETINDWAFDTLEEAVIEDSDSLTIKVALLPDAPEKTA